MPNLIETSKFSRFFTRPMTVWNVEFDERYGIATYGDPFLIYVFFTKTSMRFINKSGDEQVSKYKIVFDDPQGHNIKDDSYIIPIVTGKHT